MCAMVWCVLQCDVCYDVVCARVWCLYIMYVQECIKVKPDYYVLLIHANTHTYVGFSSRGNTHLGRVHFKNHDRILLNATFYIDTY